jgi:hypothetical protein
MKIIEETHSRLKLEHRPFRLWVNGALLFFGCFFALIGNLCLEFASASLTCQRLSPQEINCDLRRSALLGRREKVRIVEMERAYVQITRTKSTTRSDLIIVTPLGERYMVANQIHQDNLEAAQQINLFIAAGTESLLIEQNQRTFLLHLNSILFIITVYGFYLLTTPVSNCTFYKSLNQLFIERQSLRGKRIMEEPLTNILRVDIQDKRFKNSNLYRAVIVLSSEKKIPINPEYTDEKSVRDVVLRIHAFLGKEG